jgi:uncharacterized membrane protein (DUF485 family)
MFSSPLTEKSMIWRKNNEKIMKKDSFAFAFKVNVLEMYIYFLVLIFYGLILQTGTI